jgi:uncharacterized membrane protein
MDELKEQDMHRAKSWLCGLGTGLGAMYFFDPVCGPRHRALAMDKLKSTGIDLMHFFEVAGRDACNRSKGLLALGWSKLTGGKAPDDVLVNRVRSALGRHVAHPHAIKVAANSGRICLSGAALTHEVDELLECIAKVPGVQSVDNMLEVHREPGRIAALQGDTDRTLQQAFDALQSNWSPTTRLLVGAAGTWMMARCLARGGPINTLLGTAGLGMLVRSVANRDLARVAGLKPGPGIEVQKTLTINAPIERVFDFWSHYENFPRFMSNLHEVTDLGNGRSHWVAAGPAGTKVSWNARETCHEPNECIAWCSEPGTTVPNEGTVRFEKQGDGTRVTIQMSYFPPAGALGHAAATLFGSDPKSEMDADLVRLKTLLEEGKTRAPGKGRFQAPDREPVKVPPPPLATPM